MPTRKDQIRPLGPVISVIVMESSEGPKTVSPGAHPSANCALHSASYFVHDRERSVALSYKTDESKKIKAEYGRRTSGNTHLQLGIQHSPTQWPLCSAGSCAACGPSCRHILKPRPNLLSPKELCTQLLPHRFSALAIPQPEVVCPLPGYLWSPPQPQRPFPQCVAPGGLPNPADWGGNPPSRGSSGPSSLSVLEILWLTHLWPLVTWEPSRAGRITPVHLKDSIGHVRNVPIVAKTRCIRKASLELNDWAHPSPWRLHGRSKD